MTLGDLGLIIIFVTCGSFAIFCRWLWWYDK